jgi:hypothetical protein
MSAEVFNVVSFQKKNKTDLSDIKRPLILQFNQALDFSADRNSSNFCGFFFGKIKTSKSHFEINGPLATWTISDKDGVIRPERPSISAPSSLHLWRMTSQGTMTPKSMIL